MSIIIKKNGGGKWEILVDRIAGGERRDPFVLKDPFKIRVGKDGVSVSAFQFKSSFSEINGSFQILENGESLGGIRILNFDLKDLVKFFEPVSEYDLEGLATADIRLTRSLKKPALQAKGKIEGLVINHTETGDSFFDITLNHRGIEISQLESVHSAKNSRLEIRGYIPVLFSLAPLKFVFDPERERSFLIHCQNTSPSLLGTRYSLIRDFEGSLSGKIDISVFQDRRQILGDLKLKDGTFAFDTNLAPLTSMQGNLTMRDDYIEISKASAKMGEGSVQINGKILLEDEEVTSFDFSIKGKKLKMVNDVDLELVLSPDLTFSGNRDSPSLKGDIYVDYVRYDDDLRNLGNKIKTLQRAPTRETNIWPSSELDLNIICENNGHNSIKNSAFKLLLSCNLKMKGYVADPTLQGNVIVNSGRIPVYFKVFEVENGLVTFRPDRALGQPDIKLSAFHRSEKIEVKMVIDQTPEDPLDPYYTSFPSYTEEEIIRYLTTGLLPDQEGETIDIIGLFTQGLDILGIQEAEGLEWLRRFTFETRRIQKEGEDEFELGISAEYNFLEPEWLSIRAEQDDREFFNYLLVARGNFYGKKIDPFGFTDLDFRDLEPGQRQELINEIENFKNFKILPRSKDEFDINFIVKNMNHLLSEKFIERRLSEERLKKGNSQKLTEFMAKRKRLLLNQEISGKEQKLRKMNRNLLEEVFAEILDPEGKKKRKKKKFRPLKNKRLIAPGLTGGQKKILKKLVREELSNYLKTSNKFYLRNASKKMERMCKTWGFKDAQVPSFSEIKNEYLDENKTVPAVKFEVSPGKKFKLRGFRMKGLTLEEEVEVRKGIDIKFYKMTQPVFYSWDHIGFLKNRILDNFQNMGYLDVECRIIDEDFNEKGEAFVTVEVIKNRRYYVGGMEFYGNKNFGRKVLLKFLSEELEKKKIIPEKNLVDSPFHAVLLTRTRKIIKEFYKNHGFYKVQARTREKTEFEFYPGRLQESGRNLKELINAINYPPGIRNFKSRFPEAGKLKTEKEFLQYINNQIIRPKSRRHLIDYLWQTREWDDPLMIRLFNEFKTRQYNRSEMALARILLEKVLHLEQLSPEIIENLAENRKSARVIICEITEGKSYLFGKVSYRPRYAKKFKTRDFIIKKAIKIVPGKEFRIQALQNSIKALSGLGLFQEIDTVESIHGDRVEIEFILKESKSLSIEVQAGYGEFDRFQGGVRILDRNIFGTNRVLGIRTKLSEKSFLVEPLFDNPAFLKFRNLWRGFFERKNEISFIRIRVGLETTLRRQIKRNFSISFGYKFESTQADKIVDVIQEDEEFFTFSGTVFNLSFNELDSFVLPHKGIFFKLRSEFNLKALGSDFDFFKAEIGLSRHLPLSSRVTFSLGGRFGIVKSISPGVDIPVVARFFSGGTTTVRGFRNNRIGPFEIDENGDEVPVGGDARGILNAELRFPLTIKKGIQFGAIFFDAGVLEKELENLEDPEWFTSIGIGYRVILPIGPLRLDYGFGLKEKDKDASLIDFDKFHMFIGGYRGRVRLSIGYAF